jgi:hypothetical protein
MWDGRETIGGEREGVSGREDRAVVKWADYINLLIRSGFDMQYTKVILLESKSWRKFNLSWMKHIQTFV